MNHPSQPPSSPLEVRVPASTSNLGPGFDLLGIALSLYVRVRLEGPAAGDGHELASVKDQAVAWPRNADNLLFRAFDLARGACENPAPYAFHATSEVPLERGFGSSGAAVAAGLLLGDAVGRAVRDDQRLLHLGIALEGHPDNIAASLFGGCTSCHPDAGRDGAPVVVQNEVHSSIGFVLAWPASPLSTARARAALPDEVPFADAVENPRRLALLLEGLRTGSSTLITAGGQDRLHIPHRLPLIPGGAEAMAAGRRAGAWLVTISGAGSGLVALGPLAAREGIAEAMQCAFADAGEGGEARIVEPVPGPVRVYSRA